MIDGEPLAPPMTDMSTDARPIIITEALTVAALCLRDRRRASRPGTVPVVPARAWNSGQRQCPPLRAGHPGQLDDQLVLSSQELLGSTIGDTIGGANGYSACGWGWSSSGLVWLVSSGSCSLS